MKSETLKTNSEWIVLTMEEMWDTFSNFKDSKYYDFFSKPSFPTKRWGRTFTKTSVNDVITINKLLAKYKEKGFKVRKRIDYETMKRFHPSFGKFYFIQIKK